MDVTPLGRTSIEAHRLAREHPPRFRHPVKTAIFERAGGAERASGGGTVDVSRWAPSADGGASFRVGAPVDAASVDGPFAYEAKRGGDAEAWHVNFADEELFGFYGGALFAQDELQCAEHPVLASVREAMIAGALGEGLVARTSEPDRPTPVLVHGAERWCEIDTRPSAAAPQGIYGNRLARAPREAIEAAVRRLEPATRSHVLAMVAPRGRGPYTRAQIEDVLLTAATGFAAACVVSGAPAVVHTGHWGTGVFGGHRVLMAAAQILAARAAGLRALAYHSLDPQAARSFARGVALARRCSEGAGLEDAVTLLEAEGFAWGVGDGN